MPYCDSSRALCLILRLSSVPETQRTVGHTVTVPRLVRVSPDAELETAIDAFGNRVRVGIIRHLREHGPSTRGDIADALGVVTGSMNAHLRSLETAGLIASDPPPTQERSGRRVRYVLVPSRVTELYTALGAELGETPSHEGHRA